MTLWLRRRPVTGPWRGPSRCGGRCECGGGILRRRPCECGGWIPPRCCEHDGGILKRRCRHGGGISRRCRERFTLQSRGRGVLNRARVICRLGRRRPRHHDHQQGEQGELAARPCRPIRTWSHFLVFLHFLCVPASQSACLTSPALAVPWS